MRIVVFKNGKYGIRRWCFIYWYKDLRSNFWWNRFDYWFKDCQGTIEQCLENFHADKGKPI